MKYKFSHCPYCHCDFGKEPRFADNQGMRRCPECREIVEDGMTPRGATREDDILNEISALIAPGESSYEYPGQLLRMVQERIKRAEQAEAILAKIADRGDPWETESQYGVIDCFFCGEEQPNHTTDCVWLEIAKHRNFPDEHKK